MGRNADKIAERGVWVMVIIALFVAIFVPGPAKRFAEKVESPELPEVEIVHGGAVDNVPLEEELQHYIANACRYYDIDKYLVYAIIEQESGYQVDAVGDNGESYGLMQIQPKWHEERMMSYEASDLLNPYENIAIGIDILNEKIDEGLGIEWALMAYNGGNQYANEMTAYGTVSDYVEEVMERYERLRNEGN